MTESGLLEALRAELEYLEDDRRFREAGLRAVKTRIQQISLILGAYAAATPLAENLAGGGLFVGS